MEISKCNYNFSIIMIQDIFDFTKGRITNKEFKMKENTIC